MLITRTVTKKILETIVQETFSNFGSIASSSLLDSLKFLGFYYATTAGISINIEDLKTPNVKKNFLEIANYEVSFVSEQWEQGFVSDTERFQTIIDSWNMATESLKNRIIDYYQNFDPANNLYIMAFSGARGNMSQVRQLVGMRGLMSDQEGKIIDLPIQTNFREGLSSIDYIISSYGARKGIVDTALKTADSGYLTRRLIYIAQDLIIREIDCKTKNGIIILLNKNTNFTNLLGRLLIRTNSLNKNLELLKNKIITEQEINLLKNSYPLNLIIRSPLTCESNGSICQNCYGWDLAQKRLISLGEAVGIIAAQSIGEPGTQLTMRTFHTGGIFTSEVLQQTHAPFSGKIQIPKSLKTISYRTNHGIVVSKLQQEATITITNWKGFKKDIFLEIGSFLYLTTSSFIKKGTLISEFSARSVLPGVRRLKPIYTSISGEIRFESLLIRYISRDNKPKVKVNQDDGILWLTSGKVFSLPKETKFDYTPVLTQKNSVGSLKIISPHYGYIKMAEKTLVITTEKKIILLNTTRFDKVSLKNCRQELKILFDSRRIVDKGTLLAYLYLIPKIEGKVYSIRQKYSCLGLTYFLITESDIWKLHSEQINNFENFPMPKGIIRAGTYIAENLKVKKSGFLLARDGLKMVFQNALPIFVSRGTILNCMQGDFVFKNQLLATLVNYTQQTEDIVQGLPKIEELIEARLPKIKAYLALRPGIVLNPNLSSTLESSKVDLNTLKFFYTRKSSFEAISDNAGKIKEPQKNKKLIFSVVHSTGANSYKLVLFDQQLWKLHPLPPDFYACKKRKTNEYGFVNSKKQILAISINGKAVTSGWLILSPNYIDLKVFVYTSNQKSHYTELNKKSLIFKNIKTDDIIIKTSNNHYFFLENAQPISEYKVPLNTKLILKAGNFVDIGEPLTEGIIDSHELLMILFNYHESLDTLLIATVRSLNKFQLLLVNSIQSIYQSQGVNISSKHIEIIVRQMTSKVGIKQSGDTPLLPGELLRLSLMTEIYKMLSKNKNIDKTELPYFQPLLFSTTKSSLSKDGFLSAAGFQETKRVLSKAAIEGNTDWLRGLKECVIIGRLIPAGSAFLNYKNYLDNIYFFKTKT